MEAYKNNIFFVSQILLQLQNILIVLWCTLLVQDK